MGYLRHCRRLVCSLPGLRISAAVLSTLTTAVPLNIMVGPVLGKPVGIGLASWLAGKTGLAELPEGAT